MNAEDHRDERCLSHAAAPSERPQPMKAAAPAAKADEAKAVAAGKLERSAEPEAAPRKSEQVAVGPSSSPGQEDYWYYLDPSNKEQVWSHIISLSQPSHNGCFARMESVHLGSADQCQMRGLACALCLSRLHACNLLARVLCSSVSDRMLARRSQRSTIQCRDPSRVLTSSPGWQKAILMTSSVSGQKMGRMLLSESCQSC